jgi:hypothetical protein
MNCYICELPLDAGARFCGNCGAPVRAPATQQGNSLHFLKIIQSSNSTIATHSATQIVNNRSWAPAISLLAGMVFLMYIGCSVCIEASSLSAVIISHWVEQNPNSVNRKCHVALSTPT